MERLTYWNEEYGCWSYHGPSGEAAKRLAAYEDTGLEPEEIFSAEDMAKIACALRELNVNKELVSASWLVARERHQPSPMGVKSGPWTMTDWRKRFCAAGGQKWRRESLRIFPLGGVT